MRILLTRAYYALKRCQFKSIKLTLLVLLISPSLLAQVTIVVKNQPIRQALEEIERLSDYKFFYNNDLSSLDKVVSLSAKDESIEAVMSKLLVGTNITYKRDKGNLIVLTIKGTSSQQPGNDQKIKGTIVDESKRPVIGVNVVVAGTTNGTTTDLDGNFSLQVPEKAELRISYIGYLDQRIKVGNNTTLHIVLKEDTQVLDEVVVVGYGSVKKGNLTTAVTAIKSDVLTNRPVQTIADALQGEVPGLSIVQSGRPGEASSMQLRGATSLNETGSPLLLVDGVPSEFNYLNVDDIEHITVLKDAASAAIYGSRAAHGVILVTTKRGTKGKPSFRYNGSVGVNTPTDMPVMINSAEYARVRNEAQRNIGRDNTFTEEDIRKFASGEDPNRYPSTNWLDLMIQNSITTRHSIAVTGGNEVMKYYLSGGFDNQTGVVPEASHNVFNVRSNVDVAITKKFNFSFDLRYMLRKKDEVNGLNDIIIDFYKMNPTYLAYYTDGTYGSNSNYVINPMAYLHERGHALKDTHDASGIFKLEYEFIDGLKLTGLANVNYVFGLNTNIGRQLTFTNFFTQDKVTEGLNTLKEERNMKSYYNLQALLTYKKKIGEHSLDVLAGYQQENEKYDWITAYRDGYPTDIVHVLTGGSKERWENDGSAEHWAIASFIGSLNYDYAGKYLLTFKVRSDGSSRFAAGHRWSTFPSVAGAWRISGENFMKSTSSFLDDWKIRASWGKTGASSGLGLYPSYTTIGMGGVALNNFYKQTAYLRYLGNTELGWETTSMVDVGTDALLFGNRLGVTFDYYIKRTNDILIGLPVPMEYGFDKPNVNIGTVENKGWELELKWSDRIGNVSYQIQGNLSNNKNEVLDLGGTGPWKDKYTDVGLPMNSLYGYEAIGFFQSEQEIKDAPFQNVKNKPGDIRYKDQNGDNKINGDDRVIIGDPNPHFLYGIRLFAEYKGFDLSMFFQGIGKKDYIMSGPGVQPLSDSGKGPVFAHQLDYWTEENREAKYPRILESNQASFNYDRSDFWKINAGYLRMKNLQVGYNFSNSLMKNTGFRNLRLYFSASNLFTIDNFIPGYDPETNNAFTYPLARTYSFGLNVQF